MTGIKGRLGARFPQFLLRKRKSHAALSGKPYLFDPKKYDRLRSWGCSHKVAKREGHNLEHLKAITSTQNEDVFATSQKHKNLDLLTKHMAHDTSTSARIIFYTSLLLNKPSLAKYLLSLIKESVQNVLDEMDIEIKTSGFSHL